MASVSCISPRVVRPDFTSEAYINYLIEQRAAAKKAKNFAEADRIRNELLAQGIVPEDKPGGVTVWRRQ